MVTSFVVVDTGILVYTRVPRHMFAVLDQLSQIFVLLPQLTMMPIMPWTPLRGRQRRPRQSTRNNNNNMHCSMIATLLIALISSKLANAFRQTTRSSVFFVCRPPCLLNRFSYDTIPSLSLRRCRGSLFALKNDMDEDTKLSSPLLPLLPFVVSSQPLPSFSNRPPSTIWETMAQQLVQVDRLGSNPAELQRYVQYVTLFRVGIPSFGLAAIAQTMYPSVAMALAHWVIQDDAGVFAVVAQDASQYIQNILTTSGLIFSLLVGQTYYFMYQQQEAIYLALFDEVTVAKSLLEQVALVCQGRDALYHRILRCIDSYVQNDLTQFQTEPAVLLSRRPVDDPLEDILYLTSVGEPSIIYSTVRSLRQARAARLGALQRKLPNIHMILLWSLAFIVLLTFPLLGAAVQTIGGMGILKVQSWYLSFIVFGIAMTLGVINELRQPEGRGAYNVVTVLAVMVQGLDQELKMRLESDGTFMPGPTVDPDHPAYFAVVDEDDYFEENEPMPTESKASATVSSVKESSLSSTKKPLWRTIFRRRFQRD